MTRWLLVLIFAAISCDSLGDDFTPTELQDAEAIRTEEIKKLASQIAEHEKEKQRARGAASRNAVAQKILALKRELNETKRKTPELYAQEKRERREQQEAEIAALAKRKAEEEKADEERMKVNGRCPLRVDHASFGHLTDVQVIAAFHDVDPTTTLGLTPLTAVVFKVTNRSRTNVEAWEMSYELLDGFDKVVYEGSLRNPLVHPGEQAEICTSVPHVPEAVQMRIFIARTKSEGDVIWERQPDHKQVGLAVKKLEGADVVKHARN